MSEAGPTPAEISQISRQVASGIKLPSSLPLDQKTANNLKQSFANSVASVVAATQSQSNTAPTNTTTTSRVASPSRPQNTIAASPSARPVTLMNSKAILTALEFVMREDIDLEPPQVTAAVIPLRYQAAIVIAKTLGGSRISGPSADYKYASGTPEVIVNMAVRDFLRRAHTPEAWQNAGRMLQLAYQMNIRWDSTILKPSHRKIMGVS